MLICGLQKLSLLDFPEKLAATIFTGGCNLRCPFCHNAGLVTHLDDAVQIPEAEVLAFLESRRGKLDGVCITGGEPLLQPDLEGFILAIRAMGFLVKLDTNGAMPEKLADILSKGIVDYVAMDVKNSPEKYALTVGVADFDPTPVFDSAKVIMSSGVPYEFRTTLVKGFHEAADMQRIGELLAGAERYYLQSFKDSGDLVGFGNNSPCEMAFLPKDDIESFHAILSRYIKKAEIRG